MLRHCSRRNRQMRPLKLTPRNRRDAKATVIRLAQVDGHYGSITDHQISAGQDSAGTFDWLGERFDKTHPSLQASFATPTVGYSFICEPLAPNDRP